MEHVLETLPSRVSPEALNTGAPTSLRVGSVNHGAVLFETFCNEDQEQTKVKIIRNLAMDVGLTCEEFATHCGKAVEMADTADKASGFQPKEGAKGVAKYGPKRQVLNSRLSEARLIFGATKINPNLTNEVGYWKALSVSREFLSEKGLKWNGQTKPTAEQKEAKQEAKLNIKALEDVMSLHPMEAGESIRAYNDRMATLVDKAIEDKRIEQRNEVVNKVVKSLEEKYDEETLLAIADAIFGKYDLTDDPSIPTEDGNV